jgi:ArsR family transcriptional regulator
MSNEEQIEQLSILSKALSHPTRIEILYLIQEHSILKVQEIVEKIPLAQSTISQHLKALKIAGLIKYNEKGIQGYTLRMKAMAKGEKLMKKFFKQIQS